MSKRSATSHWVGALLLSLGLAFSMGALARADVTSQLSALKVTAAADGKEAFQPASSVKPGELLEYRLDYRNKGDESARGLEVTLPIPEGLVYVQDSGRPAPLRASIDGRTFQPVPLKRRVRQVDGKEVEQLVPLAEYRYLRWNPADLPAGQGLQYSARMRVIDGAATLPPVAPR